MLTSFRLFSRAPCTRIRSWASAWCRVPGASCSALEAPSSAGDSVSVFVTMAPSVSIDSGRSAELLDPEQIAGGIADREVANPVRLLDRFLNHVGVTGLQPLEGPVEVLGGQQEDAVGALGHHLGDGAALLLGDAGIDSRRMQDDRRPGLVQRADRDPAHPAVADVVTHLEAEGLAIEGQGRVRVVMR